LTGGGTGFLVVAVTGFFCCETEVVMGFFAVVEAMGALRTGVGVVFLVAAPGMAFLVPMGWATILTISCSELYLKFLAVF
jgi:hypothetical protein